MSKIDILIVHVSSLKNVIKAKGLFVVVEHMALMILFHSQKCNGHDMWNWEYES